MVEVPVDGGAGHAEQVGDLPDGLLAGVVQLLGQRGLVRGEARPASPDRRAGDS